MRLIAVSIAIVFAARMLPADADPVREVFRADRVFTVQLRISEKQWQMMQPTRASRLATVLDVHQRPTTRPSGEYVEGDRLKPSAHGYEYACVRAAVEVDGEKFADVGLRFRGNGSYGVTATSLKRPLVLDFDRFVPERQYHGRKSLYLRNNALDPSEMREALAMELCRDIGVPAPRTSFAAVFLTVDGRHDREFLGVYTVMEEVDKSFLDRNFGGHDGLLVKPEFTRSWAYLGSDWAEYDRYGIKNDGSPLERRNFMELTRVINQVDDREFHTAMRSLLDVDEFLRYVALNVAVVNTDSFLYGHNFYLYFDPKTGRASIIAWDMNYAFGSSGRTMAEWTGLSIRTPYRSGNKFLERILADESMRNAYYGHLRTLCDGVFSPVKMHARIDRMEQAVHRAKSAGVAMGRPAPTTLPTPIRRDRPDIREFVPLRVKNVMDQLATEIRTEPLPVPVVAPPVPVVQPMPPTRPAATPPPAVTPVRQPVPVVVKPVADRRLAERAARKVFQPHPLAQPLVQALDAHRDGMLSRDEAAETVQLFFLAHRRFNARPATVAAVAGTLDRLVSLVDPYPLSVQVPPVSRPTSVSLLWAEALVRASDTNADGQMTPDELLALINAHFRDTDANGDALLNRLELGQLLDRILPRP